VRYRLTGDADAQIRNILRDTKRLFGNEQVARYAGIIEEGIAFIAEDPTRTLTHEREEIGAGVRSFHLRLVSRRRSGASHILYYKVLAKTDGEAEVAVFGVLHEAAEPRRRLARLLRNLDSEMQPPGTPKPGR